MKVYAAEDSTAHAIQELFPSGFVGVYVDVGAGYPVLYSNSFPFRQRGWQVIAIEPQKQMCDEFRRLGLPVLEFACADKDIGETDFEILDYTHGLGGSSFKVIDPQPPDRLVTHVRVQALTLNTILDRYHPELDHIDVLDIDVEGYELMVLRGFDVERYSPTVIVVENLPTDTGVWLNPQRDDLYRYYDSIGYRIVATASHNEVLMK